MAVRVSCYYRAVHDSLAVLEVGEVLLGDADEYISSDSSVFRFLHLDGGFCCCCVAA